MGNFGLALTTETTPFVPVPPSFSELYQTHFAAVYRTALRVTGNAADAEDAVQAVFLRILNRGTPLDPLQSSDHYMRRAATNAAIDILRSKSSRRESPLDAGPDHSGPASTVLLKETVRRALARLDPDDAMLFVLRNVEGFSYDELAEQFGIERGTVASRLHRIRQSLLKWIKK